MLRCCAKSPTEQWEPSEDDMFFPMWLLPMSIFLKMVPGPPPSFQELQQMGVLVKWRKGMYVLFVSHQWLGEKHADPAGIHVQCLRESMAHILSGRLQVTSGVCSLIMGKVEQLAESEVAQLQDAFIWLDWYSIPQITVRQAGKDPDMDADVKKAVDSIPIYAEASNMFVILSPSAEHADTKKLCNLASWRRRGWCLAEYFSFILSRRHDQRILQVTSPSMAILDTISREPTSLFDSPADGDFSVESDRAVVLNVLRTMIDRKLEMLWAENVTHARCIEAVRNAWQGDPRPHDSESVEEFLVRFRFKSLHDTSDPCGFGPAHCATITGNHRALRELVRQGGSLETRYTQRGQVRLTPSLMAFWACDDTPTLRCLMELRANLQIKEHVGGTCLTSAVLMNRVECTKILLEEKADPNVESILKFTVLQGLPLLSIRTDAAALLLQNGASVNAVNDLGLTALHMAALTGNATYAQLLLDHNADVNAVVTPSLAGRVVLMMLAFIARTSSGPTKLLQGIRGMTPLGIANFIQDSSMVKLLRSRADQPVRDEVRALSIEV